MHFDFVANSINNWLEHRNRRDCTIKLTAAMVGHDNRIGAGFGCHSGIFFIENAFEDQLAAPLFLDPRDIVPVELRIELFRCP
ncbi:hypothetical protein D9M69_707070 [compost metagenome]